jgi:hypothetical protein
MNGMFCSRSLRHDGDCRCQGACRIFRSKMTMKSVCYPKAAVWVGSSARGVLNQALFSIKANAEQSRKQTRAYYAERIMGLLYMVNTAI